MTIVKQGEIRSNIKRYFDMAYDGEVIIVPRKQNRNVVILSEQDYKALAKARRNEEYIAMLDASAQQYREGQVIEKDLNELDIMAEE